MFGQASIVKDEDAIGHRMQGEQSLHAHFIQFEWVPGRVGEQVLQPLNGSSRYYIRDGITGLVREIGKQPGQVAFHAVSARMSSEQRGKGRKFGCQFR